MAGQCWLCALCILCAVLWPGRCVGEDNNKCLQQCTCPFVLRPGFEETRSKRYCCEDGLVAACGLDSKPAAKLPSVERVPVRCPTPVRGTKCGGSARPAQRGCAEDEDCPDVGVEPAMCCYDKCVKQQVCMIAVPDLSRRR